MVLKTSTMQHLMAKSAASAANRLLTLLRNRIDLRLTREEFRFSRVSFSQFGEDLAVLRWLDEHKHDAPLIYVDAGCFHPIHFSNTLLLHKRGWTGINVDMGAQKIAKFDLLRPSDHNIVAALSDKRTSMTKYEYDASGLTDRLGVEKSVVGDHPLRALTVETTTLNDILATTAIERVGYLNIDCEGHDLQVLRGLDMAQYRPEIITIEAFPERVSETVETLSAAGYGYKEKLHQTLLFVRGN